MPEKQFKLPLFIYDDKCILCVRFKDAVKRIPGTEIYQIVPLSNKDIFKAYKQLDIEACNREMHLIDTDLKIYKGSDALKILIKTFPAIEKLSWLIESQMGSKAIDFFYTMSNKYRKSLLNKCPGCRVK